MLQQEAEGTGLLKTTLLCAFVRPFGLFRFEANLRVFSLGYRCINYTAQAPKHCGKANPLRGGDAKLRASSKKRWPGYRTVTELKGAPYKEVEIEFSLW
jgi:hypothetical protein